MNVTRVKVCVAVSVTQPADECNSTIIERLDDIDHEDSAVGRMSKHPVITVSIKWSADIDLVSGSASMTLVPKHSG